MSAHTGESLTEKDKIQILLSEYGTLRQEILTRTSVTFQLFAVGAVLFTWIMAQTWNARLCLALILAIPAMIMGGWVTYRDIVKAAARIRELEKDINVRAGEDLLVWETFWGGAVTGFLGRAKKKTP